MGDWQVAANRGLSLLANDGSDASTRTQCILNKVLGGGNDSYIGDKYNVQQTAGGLPDGTSLESFIAAVSYHVRDMLAGSSFDDSVSDDDFRSAVMTFDQVIRDIIVFLNGVVHQIAPGDAQVGLWNYILSAKNDSSSLYSCYSDYIQT